MEKYSTSVVAVIQRDDKILVGKKIVANHWLSDSWHIPGGKVKQGENEEEALVREMNEETGITVKVNKFLGEKFVPQNSTVAKWFLCSPLTNNFKPGSDLAELKFVKKSELFNFCDPKAIALWPEEVVKLFK